jgi:F420-dependent oxidoreductase-like protein
MYQQAWSIHLRSFYSNRIRGYTQSSKKNIGTTMTEIAIMIEGQDGLNWPRWQKMAQAVDDLGFAGLYRSDHFTNAGPPDKDSLELWVSLTWLASHTRSIEFGPLVSPVSFRDPVFTARTALQVDDLSGGRLRLGVGAGWQEREHDKFGYDLMQIPERFARFEEGLEVIQRLMHSDQPVSYSGKYYQLRDALLLPRPRRPGGPPIVIGGNGEKRTLPLVARYADEWNGVFQTPERMQQLNAKLDDMLRQNGRGPDAVRRTMMTGLYFGRTSQELQSKLEQRSAEELVTRGLIAGTPAQVVDQIGRYQQASVQRLMLQWLWLDDLDGIEHLAQSVLPQVV